MQPDRDEIITAAATANGLQWNRPGRYRLRTWDRGKYAMVTDLGDDNPGPSVTNNAEALWSAVERLVGIDLLEGPWCAIEHYERTSGPDTFDLVLFSGRHCGQLTRAQWRPGNEIVTAATEAELIDVAP